MQAHAGAVVAVVVGYRPHPVPQGDVSIQCSTMTLQRHSGNLGTLVPDAGTRRGRVWASGGGCLGRPLKGRS